jgi:SAM-dependent methyltransferase
VLDVGCGPGRHAIALAARGIEVVGVDLSWRFVALAGARGTEARFVRADARALPIRDDSFDAAISLCQGAFGLLGGPGADAGGEARVLEAMAGAVRPGGRVVVSAFSSYFQVRHLEEGNQFEAGTGVHHEHTSVRDETGQPLAVELWTTCFTPRELRLLVAAAGLRCDDVWSVEPGRYGRHPPNLETAEFLVNATKAGGSLSGR